MNVGVVTGAARGMGAAFLVSHDASFVTGVDVRVDGGEGAAAQ